MIEKVLKQPSPVWSHARLSDDLGVDVRVKRDDLIPFFGGGNKVRKMVPIIKAAERQGANAIVTAGGANSNHLRVFAWVAAYLGWHCSAIVHSDSRPDLEANANLQLVYLLGADVRYCTLVQTSTVMDDEMERLRKSGYSPYYVWGGGHTIEGIGAYVQAVDEARQQFDSWMPDYIIVASGTGGTHAGLHIGAARTYPDTEVVGISVARDKVRGMQKLKDTIDMYLFDVGEYDREVGGPTFYDEYIGGGYEGMYPRLASVIKRCAKKYGLVLDPVYTGKAFTGLADLIDKEVVPTGSKVLFWHTGGMLNLFPISKLSQPKHA